MTIPPASSSGGDRDREVLLIPGADGDPAKVSDLARHVPAVVTVAAARGFSGRPDRTLPSQARRQRELLERQAPPRVVIGYSVGALVALELATTVADVGLLIMIDPPPLAEGSRRPFWAKRASLRAAHLARRADSPTPRERTVGGRLAGDLALEAKIARGYFHALIRSVQIHDGTPARGDEKPDTPQWHASSLAYWRYRPASFAGRTLIIRGTGWMMPPWGPSILRGPTTVFEVVSDHPNMLRGRSAAEVGRIIGQALDDLDGTMGLRHGSDGAA